MLKGLILNAENNEPDLQNDKNNIDIRIGLLTGKIQMIDTRNLDFIVISPEQDNKRDDIIADFIDSMEKTNNDTVVLDIDGEKHYIEKKKIAFAEVIGRDCFIYMQDRKIRLTRNALYHVMDKIDDPYFVRCHKSYALNVRLIEGTCKIGRGLWKPVFRECDNSEECLIGRSYYKNVIEKHEEWLRLLNKLK